MGTPLQSFSAINDLIKKKTIFHKLWKIKLSFSYFFCRVHLILATCDHHSKLTLALSAVRLIQGLSASEGLVQVYLNNTWVWVCDQHWDKQDADVACRELGYTGKSVLFSGLAHVQGNDSLWINNVQCIGNEISFAFCAHDVWTNGSCQNAGVVCNGPEGNNRQ